MNEARRLAYLDALGIDSYISRRQLPAAAGSRRLRAVEKPAVSPRAKRGSADGRTPGNVARAGEQSGAVEPLRAAREMLADAASPAPRATPPAPEQAAPDPGSAPVFSVAACFLAGRCWLGEVPRARELGEDYVQLLQGICTALGWDSARPVLERFDWPMRNHRHLDQGMEAARHGFEGFIRARLERHPVRGVILLGEAQADWLNALVLDDLELRTTVSAWQMLKQPELKSRAWAELKQLAAVPPGAAD